MNKFLEIKETSQFNGVEDLYICAMGFEDRSLDSNKHLLDHKFKTKKAIILRYDSYIKENEKNREAIENTISQFSEELVYVQCSLQDRSKNVSNLNKVFASLKLPLNSVTINITSLTTHPLLWLINFLLDNSERLKIVYTEPEGYGNQLETSNAFSSGVKEIFTMPEFSGAMLPGYSSLLVIFLGYDFVRARGIYQQIQPSKKIGIMAHPNTPKLERLFASMQREHRKSFSSTDEIKNFSIFDLQSVIDGLTDIRSKNVESANTSIALNGSKLHSIAALLFARKYRDIQLVVSTPLEYFPSSYSYGSRRTFEINIERKILYEFETAKAIFV